jgi:hypothetical protein
MLSGFCWGWVPNDMVAQRSKSWKSERLNKMRFFEVDSEKIGLHFHVQSLETNHNIERTTLK